MKNFLLIFFLTSISSFRHAAVNNADAIIGKWMNAEDNNLEVQVYKVGNEYKAKVVWFDDSDDKNKPMAVRCDTENPDKTLRNRKILGLEVLHGLVYNADEDEWQGGRIYDASTGKDWNAKAWITEDGCLKVRGFWHFEFLGRNMRFKKIG
jgi:uncharacterized protein (DUF2147 family)